MDLGISSDRNQFKTYKSAAIPTEQQGRRYQSRPYSNWKEIVYFIN